MVQQTSLGALFRVYEVEQTHYYHVVIFLLLYYTLLRLCVRVVLVYIKVEISLLWVPLITALKRKRLLLCVSRES